MVTRLMILFCMPHANIVVALVCPSRLPTYVSTILMILKIRWQITYEEKSTKITMNLVTNVRIVGGVSSHGLR
jgi:hypothetical protein